MSESLSVEINQSNGPRVASPHQCKAISYGLTAIFGLLLVTLVGCSAKTESLIEQQIGILERATTILRQVADNDQANQAVPPVIDDAELQKRLAQSGQQMNELRTELTELIPQIKALQLNSEKKSELETANLSKYEPALISFNTQVQRIRGLRTKDIVWTEFIATIDQVER
ncbi:MAG: hypothetical protein SGJ20_01935 [Planctomycetota bacterium]|nr:hypothetical protein [Planctomycetota bacterium]